MKPLIISHANCADGFGAAYAAWVKFGDDADYLFAHYNEPAPDVAGRDVYVLDFSFDKDTTLRMMEQARSFVWLDHHKTAFENWCGAAGESHVERRPGVHIVLDNGKSGAVLAWEHFHPEKDLPLLSAMIDDRDRWQFKLSGSRDLHTGLHLRPYSFEDWHRLTPVGSPDSGRNLADVIRQGAVVQTAYQQQIDASASKAVPCRIIPAVLDSASSYLPPWTWEGNQFGATGLAVNTPTHISEVGHELAKASGTFGLVWYYDGQRQLAQCSLRSTGEYDVSAIAKVFGGGGHKNAAGFSVEVPQLLSWLGGTDA